MLQTRQPPRNGRPESKRAPDSWIRMHDIMAWIYLYPVRGMCNLIPVNVLIWLTQRLAPLYARLRRDIAVPVSQHMAKSLKGHDLSTLPEVLARSFLAKGLRKSIDDLVIRRLSTETLGNCATVRGIEFLDEALADGKGVIVISGHFNANRLAKYYLRRIGYTFMSVRNPVPISAAMGRFGNRYAAPAYGRFLNTIIEDEIHSQDAGLGAGLLRRLRDNGMINVNIDASVAKEKFRVTCLNKKRQFAGGFLRLAELTGAPLVPMQCLGNSSGFEIVFGKPIRYVGRSSTEEFMSRIELMVGLLESWVLAHPTEWVLWSGENR
ncbi:MAG: hypothetical protein GQ538_02055 [Xanthomonadales bacterium]|nr:hypothetical protein [Xanthomonadales bacterium]